MAKETDPLDSQDFKILMQAILRSAVTDYITLQHPAKRRKADIRKAMGSAVDMLFDDTYRAMKLYTPEGKPMTLKDIVEGAHPDNVIDLEEMRERIIKEAEAFWSEADVHTLDIPEFLCIRGVVYSVYHKDNASEVDFDNYLIYQDLHKGQKSQQEFVSLCMQIAAYHSDAKISGQALKDLSQAWFEILRMNNCFTGV